MSDEEFWSAAVLMLIWKGFGYEDAAKWADKLLDKRREKLGAGHD